MLLGHKCPQGPLPRRGEDLGRTGVGVVPEGKDRKGWHAGSRHICLWPGPGSS